MRFKIFFERDIMIEKALEFAKAKHRGQTRYDGLPYIIHPELVAELVKKYIPEYTNEMIEAALLHDTLEDTRTTYEELSEEFGKEVADLVSELTSVEVDKLEAGGKKYYLTSKMNTMSETAFTLKLLDRLHNVSDAEKVEGSFRAKYKAETQYILSHLTRKLNPIQKKIINKINEVMSNY